MTAEAAVLNKAGVALAADSKSSLRIKGILKSHDSANKLFTLSKYHPVGIMINGNAEFMDIPWETVIKLYRDRLREKALPALEGYADDFVFSLTSDHPHSEDTQKENVFFILCDLLQRMRRRSAELQKRGRKSSEARKEAIDTWSSVDLARPDLPSMAGITAETIREHYAEELGGAIETVFDDIAGSQKNKLVEYCASVLTKDRFSDGRSEVIVAGFGDAEVYPSLKSWVLDGVVADRLRCKVCHATTIHPTGTIAMIHPFAQREMVNRFMHGIDPDYRDVLRRTFHKVMQSMLSDIINKYVPADPEEKERLLEETTQLVADKVAEQFGEFDAYERATFTQPIIDMTVQLPKDELAHLAESLVNLTSLKRRVSLDAESVGGAIDVAVISKGDGFIWIKRKHYFDPDLNRTFISNYFRRYISAAGETARDRQARPKK